MTAPIDYAAVLADLEAKRGQIDAAIAVIRSLIGNGGGVDMAPQGTGTSASGGIATPSRNAAPLSAPGEIQTDAFFRLSTSASIKKYLGMMKRPQTAKVIADALRLGGQVHAADEKTAYVNVSTALRRTSDFVQTRNKEWGLAEWYGAQPKGDGE